MRNHYACACILQFIREFIHDLVENSDDADDEASPFLVHSGRQHQDEAAQEVQSRSKQLFIDAGVYTRNRMFRVLGSSKYRRDAILRHLSDLSATSSSTPSVSDALDRDLFLKCLVCPFPTLQAMETHFADQDTTQFPRILHCDADHASKRNGSRPLWASHGLGRSRVSNALSVECRQSMFPKLDAFVRSTATKGGIQGEIRAIQMLFDNAAGAVLPSSSTRASEELRTKAPPKCPWMVIYQMARNRWCWNVQRAHKSNNVMLVVDLDQRVLYQKCHDQGCKAIDYR